MAKKILYCVLNWGLGHASRSIPIIQEQLDAGHQVGIASDGIAGELLKKSFPDISYYKLPAYDIQYKYESMTLNMLTQARKFFKAIRQEKLQTEAIVRSQGYNYIISDNRYGCYVEEYENVFLTHQIRLLHARKFIQSAASKLNKRLIEKFDLCWVPDLEGTGNLSGALSHKVELDIPIHYIGPQSRFQPLTISNNYQYKCLAILSGPEPQRSNLENILKSQLAHIPGQHIIVKGKGNLDQKDGNISILGMLDHTELEKLISQSEFIISRSGYSSLMDYHIMGRRAIIIPTPGQTEQVYLAQKMGKMGIHDVATQGGLDLGKLVR